MMVRRKAHGFISLQATQSKAPSGVWQAVNNRWTIQGAADCSFWRSLLWQFIVRYFIREGWIENAEDWFPFPADCNHVCHSPAWTAKALQEPDCGSLLVSGESLSFLLANHCKCVNTFRDAVRLWICEHLIRENFHVGAMVRSSWRFGWLSGIWRVVYTKWAWGQLPVKCTKTHSVCEPLEIPPLLES